MTAVPSSSFLQRSKQNSSLNTILSLSRWTFWIRSFRERKGAIFWLFHVKSFYKIEGNKFSVGGRVEEEHRVRVLYWFWQISTVSYLLSLLLLLLHAFIRKIWVNKGFLGTFISMHVDRSRNSHQTQAFISLEFNRWKANTYKVNVGGVAKCFHWFPPQCYDWWGK